MEEFEEISKSECDAISKSRKQLMKISSDRYWNEFKGNWESYLKDAFKYDTEDKSVPKPFRIKTKKKKPVNPFW